jgi:hypothetical protein
MAYTDIDDPTIYFDTTLYTGNGSSQTLTMDNIGLLWMKRRDSSIRHCLFDSVRGGHYTGSGNAPLLVSDSSAGAQGTDIDSATKGITFGATQTVIGNDSAGYSYNVSGHSMVGWQWSAGGSASSNTDGSITSTVSANTTSGFSIVSYTGTGSTATVGHGLSSAPKMIIVKDLSATKNWTVYHIGVGNDKDILLDVTNAENTSTAWNNTTPTSSVFSIGTLGNVNTSSNNYIAYCFAEKKGYSKFGSYTGNGNADGTFVYTGFKPAWVMVKDSTSTGQWFMRDNKRDTYNTAVNTVYANSSGAEESSQPWDMLSNGFKMRNTDVDLNSSSESYIYMCFAENPFTTSTGIPTTAR